VLHRKPARPDRLLVSSDFLVDAVDVAKRNRLHCGHGVRQVIGVVCAGFGRFGIKAVLANPVIARLSLIDAHVELFGHRFRVFQSISAFVHGLILHRLV